jgi:hypothetical protein
LAQLQLNDIVFSMTTNAEPPKASTYFFLLVLQIFGALIFTWQELPDFRQVAIDPGKQLPKDIFSDLVMVGVFLMMQISFWCRVLYVPIPSRRSNVFLGLIFLFLGRLSFIFGSALFSVVVFRHLPQLGSGADLVLMLQRGMILVGCLFALFCTSLEVERLGQAFGSTRD